MNDYQSSAQSGGSGDTAYSDWYITFEKEELSLETGDKASISLRWKGTDALVWTSSDETIVSVNGWRITAKKPGQAVVTACFKNHPEIKAECKVTVAESSQTVSGDKDDAGQTGEDGQSGKSGRPAKSGTVLSNTAAIYVVQNDTNTVSYATPQKNTVKSVTIPATVDLSGRTYQVTSIDAKAFYGCKKLTKVTIGKNITTIGKKAFYGCKKLKKITIKSTVLKKVGANALKGTSNKLVVKVPASKKKAYKKLLKGKGNKRITVK